MSTYQTNKSQVQGYLQNVSMASKQLLAKFPCGSWSLECWCGRLPPGRSHTCKTSRASLQSEIKPGHVLLLWEAERFLLLLILTQRGNACRHGPISDTPKCSHVFEGPLKLSLSRYIGNFHNTSSLNQELYNPNASSRIYLHRGQYSLGSCYAETWLALAPKTRDRGER